MAINEVQARGGSQKGPDSRAGPTAISRITKAQRRLCVREWTRLRPTRAPRAGGAWGGSAPSQNWWMTRMVCLMECASAVRFQGLSSRAPPGTNNVFLLRLPLWPTASPTPSPRACRHRRPPVTHRPHGRILSFKLRGMWGAQCPRRRPQRLDGPLSPPRRPPPVLGYVSTVSRTPVRACVPPPPAPSSLVGPASTHSRVT
jgi:hypothetical protein